MLDNYYAAHKHPTVQACSPSTHNHVTLRRDHSSPRGAGSRDTTVVRPLVPRPRPGRGTKELHVEKAEVADPTGRLASVPVGRLAPCEDSRLRMPISVVRTMPNA